MNVLIGNITYRISEERDGNNVYINDDTCRMGVTYFPTKRIILHANTEPDLKRKVLIHELTHAFANEFGFNTILNEGKFEHETLADFMGAYADDIIKIADAYMEYRKKVREERLADILYKKADKS